MMSFPLPRSLRGRITLAAIVLVAIVLTVAAVLIVALQRRQLLENIDDALDREAAQAIAELNNDPSLGMDPSLSMRGFLDDRFVQVLDDNGSVLAASSPLIETEPIIGPAQIAAARIGVVRMMINTTPIEDGRYRILARAAELRGARVTIVVGDNADDLRDSLVALLWTLGLTIPLATAVLGAISWFLVGRTLRPVTSIQRQVGAITLNRLSDRVAVPDSGDEIAELAATMNAMLDRLDQANERQQRFIADASHELRSPLTRLRTSLEVDLAEPDRDLNQTGAELLDDVEELQGLIDELLFLARVGTDSAVAMHDVDLDAVVDRWVDRLTVPEHVHVDTSGVAPVVVYGNEPQLARLLGNLVTNAMRHCAGLVWIETAERGDTIVLVVEDDGPGIPPDARERVFERFTRLDDSRTAASGGAGLGLALVREIALAHGANVHIEPGRRQGARFVVGFPSAPTSP